MNLPRSFSVQTSAAILFLCATGTRVKAQSNSPKHHSEQTSFSVESDFEHSIPLDEAAKEALATSPGLADDLKQKHLEPKALPDRWFVASKIQLGDGIAGLVVMGPVANSAPFWVLHQTAKGYDLVLDTIAANLKVLKTETNGFRDIETSASTSAGSWASNEFQFDGHRYQVTKQIAQTTGAKIPTDLARHETHAPFVQRTAADGSTLADARTWIWQHWKERKSFYVTVVTQDDDGIQATYQLYTSDDSDNPGLVVKVYTSHWEQDSPSRPRRRIADDDLWIATDVKRAYPAIDEYHDPQAIPDERDVASSVYRLGFLDFPRSLARHIMTTPNCTVGRPPLFS